MASTYSTNLKIELQATGENSGTWGTITNTNLGTALEQAIVGYGNPNYASDANLTLTYTDTNAAQAARALVLNVTSGVSLTGTRELVVPTIQKQYIVQNNTTGAQSITVKTSAGTGITVPNGRKAHLYVNGTDVIYMDDYVDINGGAIDGTPIGANSASTGAFTTLSASGNITVSGGTANGVLYLDGSKVATSGSALTFNGTDFVLASGGLLDIDSTNAAVAMRIRQTTAGTGTEFNTTVAENTGVTFDCSDSGGAIARSFIWTAAGSEQMRLTSTGLGIGTTSPANALEIARGAGVAGGASLRGNGNSAAAEFFVGQGSGSDAFLYNRANATMIFGTNNATRMTLTAAGDLGIGITSPSSRLHVSAGSGSGAAVFATVGNTAGGAQLGVNTSGAVVLGAFATNSTLFGYNNSTTFVETMRLDTSGNLGLGVTPSGWASGWKVLEAQGGFLGGGATSYLELGQNNYYDGAFKYKTTAAASLYEQISGAHRWYNAPSGTAGNAITFTQAMTLDASGNLALGTTSAASLFHMAKGGGYAWQYMDSYGAGYYGILDARCSRNSTVGSFTATNSGDTLLLIRANGTNSGATAFAQGASIEILQSGAAGATYVPAAIKFNTSDGTNAVAERARITSDGNLLVGTTTNVSGLTGVISDVSGNVRAIPQSGSDKTTSYTLVKSDVGKFIGVGSGGSITVPDATFATGDVVSIFNNTTGNVTLTMTITTAYIGGTNTDKATITLATRGVATILFISGTVCVVNGNVS